MPNPIAEARRKMALKDAALERLRQRKADRESLVRMGERIAMTVRREREVQFKPYVADAFNKLPPEEQARIVEAERRRVERAIRQGRGMAGVR